MKVQRLQIRRLFAAGAFAVAAILAPAAVVLVAAAGPERGQLPERAGRARR